MKKNSIQRRNELESAPKPKWNIAKGSVAGAGQVVRRRIAIPSSNVAAASTYSLGSDSVASATDWGNLSGAYGSYRVTGIRFWVGENSSVSGLQSNGLFASCTYRNGNVPASTLAAIWAGENAQLWNADNSTARPVKIEARPVGFGDCEWVSTSGPANQPTGAFGIKLYNGTTVSLLVFVEMSIELRSNV